ncbi:MAG: T9SS type A sorting domain-containing protein [Sphingobacteriales bacterium]|nr:MAG: T9SS type A sorting domain-containing protein [Sphingobacteriales bacterium]
MNKKFYSSAFLLLAMATGAQAQHSRLVAKSVSVYNVINGSYHMGDSTYYRYSGQRGGDLTHPILSDSAVRFTGNMAGVLVPTSGELCTYDANDNMLTHQLASGDIITGAYQNQFSTMYLYNASNQLISDSSISWLNGVSNPAVANHYTYNAAGKILTEERYAANTMTGNWPATASFQFTSVYGAGGELESWTADNDDNGSLVHSVRHLYTYNAAGQMTLDNYQCYTTGGTWATTEEIRYGYNSNGQVATETMFTAINTRMDTTRHYLNTYDVNGDLAVNIMETYDYATHSFTPQIKLAYTYNTVHQVTSAETEWWIASAWQKDNGSQLEQYYYEAYFPTSVAKIQQQGGSLKVYPVPAGSSLHVDIHWNIEQSYTLIVADMMGRVVLQRTGNSEKSAMDISALSTGAYNIILKGDKGGVTHSKFTIAR